MFSIKELKEKAVPVAKEFGIDELSLFGSYARNEQKEDIKDKKILYVRER